MIAAPRPRLAVTLFAVAALVAYFIYNWAFSLPPA
jgi:hypothetical protein